MALCFDVRICSNGVVAEVTPLTYCRVCRRCGAVDAAVGPSSVTLRTCRQSGSDAFLVRRLYHSFRLSFAPKFQNTPSLFRRRHSRRCVVAHHVQDSATFARKQPETVVGPIRAMVLPSSGATSNEVATGFVATGPRPEAAAESTRLARGPHPEAAAESTRLARGPHPEAAAESTRRCQPRWKATEAEDTAEGRT